jgi:hypothetical protein
LPDARLLDVISRDNGGSLRHTRRARRDLRCADWFGAALPAGHHLRWPSRPSVAVVIWPNWRATSTTRDKAPFIMVADSFHLPIIFSPTIRA